MSCFEGAGYLGSREFIQLLWDLVDDISRTEEISEENKDDMKGCIIAGAAHRGNWDLVEEYQSDETKDAYLEGLIKGNHLDRFIEYLNSDEAGYIPDTTFKRLVYVAVENSDPTMLNYLLQLDPHLADDAAKFALLEGKTSLYKRLEQSYILTPDVDYLDAALQHLHYGGSLSILPFILDRFDIANIPDFQLSDLYGRVGAIDPSLFDLLIERAPNNIPYTYLAGIIQLDKYDSFVHLVNKLNIPREGLTVLLTYARQFGRPQITKYLEDKLAQ